MVIPGTMKKSKASRKFRQHGQASREAASNPFERLSSGKRFDVLGRKTKGGVQEKTRLRSAATELVRRDPVNCIPLHGLPADCEVDE